MFKYVAFTPYSDQHTQYGFNELDDRTVVNRFDVDAVSVEFDDEDAFTDLLAHQPKGIKAKEITKEAFASIVEESQQMKRIYARGNRFFETEMRSITEKYTEEERSSWPSQVEEANAYFSSGTIGPIITACAAADGVAAEKYAQNILDKKKTFDAAVAEALAKKRMFVSALKAEVGV